MYAGEVSVSQERLGELCFHDIAVCSPFLLSSRAFSDILIWKSKKAVPAGVTIVPAPWLQTGRGVVHVLAKRIGTEQFTAFSTFPYSPLAHIRACRGGL